MIRPGRVACALLLLATGCVPRTPAPAPHYELGRPYQADGVWHYPAEDYDLDETGLASVLALRGPGLTTDGETFDQSAMAGAHATLQLPAIARVTNLENGRSLVLRINDRGTGTPHRLIEVTRQVAQRLGIPEAGAAQVRLQVLGNESHAAADALPNAPRLALATVPRAAVQSTDLPPPPGTRESKGHRIAVAPQPTAAAPTTAAATATEASPMLRLPAQVTQGAAQPGRLWVRLDTFTDYQYAVIQRAKLIGLGPVIVTLRNGRTRAWRVQVGPLASVAEADRVLDRALGAGIPDARIVVE